MFGALLNFLKGIFKSVGFLIKIIFYLLLGLIGLAVVLAAVGYEPEPVVSDAQKEADIEAAYKTAQSLPASDACGNVNAYRKIIDLEQKYELEKYSAFSKQKIEAYSEPCDRQSIMEASSDSRSDRKKKLRDEHMSEFENVALNCRNSNLKFNNIQRSQPRYIITGDYYDSSNLRKPANDYEDDEMILRIAKVDEKIIKYETYRLSTVNGELVDYSFGESEPKLEQYDLGSWDLERDTLSLSKLDTEETTHNHPRIGDYPVTWYFYVQYECSLMSNPVDGFTSFIRERQNQYSVANEARERAQELNKALEQKAKEEAQKNSNQI